MRVSGIGIPETLSQVSGIPIPDTSTEMKHTLYQEALAIEMDLRNTPYEREVSLPISYKNQQLRTMYRADFICFDNVVVELKALKKLSGVEEAQILNYLKATGFQTGLLLNFGSKSLEYKRFVFSKTKKSA